jgi:hypothetical protein
MIHGSQARIWEEKKHQGPFILNHFLLKDNFICFEIKPDFSFIEVVADRVVKVLGNATFSGSVAAQLKQFNFIQNPNQN